MLISYEAHAFAIGQKLKYLSDKDPVMNQLAQAILSAAQSLPEGGLLSPKEFLHLASRAAVDQTLTRLVRDGQLLRVGRGLYARPVPSRFGARPPATQAIIDVLESAHGEVIVASGASESNALGLTTQVPTREVFLTSGASRTLQLGQRRVAFEHAKPWLLALGKRPSGRAIRALSWLGPAQGTLTLPALHRQLSGQEWAALRSARSILPSWLARAISDCELDAALAQTRADLAAGRVAKESPEAHLSRLDAM